MLDKSQKNFTVIFKLSLGFYLISFILFSSVKYLIKNCSAPFMNTLEVDKSYEFSRHHSKKSDYEEFENEQP